MKGRFDYFYCEVVTRRHSFGNLFQCFSVSVFQCFSVSVWQSVQSVLTTLLKSTFKKKPVKQRVFFHKPTGGFVRVPLLNSELMERCYFFFHPEQLRYQYCVQEIGVYNDKTYF